MENVFTEKSNNLSRRTLLKAVPGAAVAAATSPLWLPSRSASAASYVESKVWYPNAMATEEDYAFVLTDFDNGLKKVRAHPGGIANDWTLEATYIDEGAFKGSYEVRDPNSNKILENEDIDNHSERKLWEFAPELGDLIGQPAGVHGFGEATIGLFMQYRRYRGNGSHWVVFDVYTEVGWMRRVFNEDTDAVALELMFATYVANGNDWLQPGIHALAAATFVLAEQPLVGSGLALAGKADARIAIAIGITAAVVFGLDFAWHYSRIAQRIRNVEELYYSPPGPPPVPGQAVVVNPAYFPVEGVDIPEGIWN